MPHVLAQELREAVLQAAIQGKLTEQIYTDSNANENYKVIKDAHSRISPCKSELDYSSMDFEIPSNWVMTELNELFDFVDYRGKTPNKTKEGVFLITASNIRKGYMDYTRKEYISEDEYQNRQSRGITEYGDLLFTTEAPMGMAALCDLEKTSCGQRVITFKEYVKGRLIPKLYMLFILSPAFQHQLLDNCTGTTAKGIKADKLKHFLIPLPPIEEQARIVARVDELMAKIDEYEKIERQLTELHKAFPGNMRDAILQAAFSGSLSEQNENDQSAFDVMKTLGIRETNDNPYELPDNWVWTCFGDVSTYSKSKKKINAKDAEPTAWMLDMEDIEKGGTLLVKKTVADRKAIGDKTVFSKGNILYAKLRPYLQKILIAEDDGICTPELVPFDMLGGINSRYALYYLKSPYVDSEVNKASYGVKMPRVGTETMCKLRFPVCPKEEQERIVRCLDKIIPLCDRLQEVA